MEPLEDIVPRYVMKITILFGDPQTQASAKIALNKLSFQGDTGFGDKCGAIFTCTHKLLTRI